MKVRFPLMKLREASYIVLKSSAISTFKTSIVNSLIVSANMNINSSYLFILTFFVNKYISSISGIINKVASLSFVKIIIPKKSKNKRYSHNLINLFILSHLSPK